MRIYRDKSKGEIQPTSPSTAPPLQSKELASGSAVPPLQLNTNNPKMASSNKEESAHPRPDVTVAKSSPNKKDLMISYSHADKEIMMKVRGEPNLLKVVRIFF